MITALLEDIVLCVYRYPHCYPSKPDTVLMPSFAWVVCAPIEMELLPEIRSILGLVSEVTHSGTFRDNTTSSYVGLRPLTVTIWGHLEDELLRLAGGSAYSTSSQPDNPAAAVGDGCDDGYFDETDHYDPQDWDDSFDLGDEEDYFLEASLFGEDYYVDRSQQADTTDLDNNQAVQATQLACELGEPGCDDLLAVYQHEDLQPGYLGCDDLPQVSERYEDSKPNETVTDDQRKEEGAHFPNPTWPEGYRQYVRKEPVDYRYLLSEAKLQPNGSETNPTSQTPPIQLSPLRQVVLKTPTGEGQ